MKCAIAAGKIVIVAVGWDSTSEIAWKFAKSEWDRWRNKPNPQEPSTIGHYMVLVGYDTEYVQALDPADPLHSPLKSLLWQDFLSKWNQGNFAIEPASMWAISKEFVR